MTRQLTITKEFEEGTLIKITPHQKYPSDGTSHAYYVPDKARIEAGREEAREMDSSYSLFDENGRETAKELVTASDLVERVERQILNRADGAVSTTGGWRMSRRFQSSGEKKPIPDGIVKFGDPDIDKDDAPSRDPVERGLLWGVLQDSVLAGNPNARLDYQNDVQSAGITRARVPMSIVGKGQTAIAAYLAAHDHRNRLIASILDTDYEILRDDLERFSIVD